MKIRLAISKWRGGRRLLLVLVLVLLRSILPRRVWLGGRRWRRMRVRGLLIRRGALRLLVHWLPIQRSPRLWLLHVISIVQGAGRVKALILELRTYACAVAHRSTLHDHLCIKRRRRGRLALQQVINLVQPTLVLRWLWSTGICDRHVIRSRVRGRRGWVLWTSSGGDLAAVVMHSFAHGPAFSKVNKDRCAGQ
ncbi:hypothetical protein GQ54DRAFT_51458 [Martensiomyces pterosporus]|nr:hypothetical protein GQ54DRAFT_51458 [Martensiomyces pterosporus]